jgi:hypothetical protein
LTHDGGAIHNHAIVTLAPPRPPSPEELEALIREARARQRRRWLGAAALVAVLSGIALGIYSVTSSTTGRATTGGASMPAVRSGKACGIRVSDTRILDADGRTLYREPGDWTPSYPHPSVVRCSGSTAWVVWDNGAASSQEAYVGVRSGDGGRLWKLVFAEGYFGVNAPHELDAYMGPWTLHGRSAYFTGWCPVCGGPKTVSGTTSLWVTKDGGRTFRRYRIPGLIGYQPVRVRVSGSNVAISAKGFFRGSWRRKTVTLHAG